MGKSKKVIAALSTAILLTAPVSTVAAKTNMPVKATEKKEFDTRTLAEQYLKKHAKTYKMKSNLSDLKYVTTISTQHGSYVRFEQTINNAPVFTKEVTVTVAPHGKVALVVSDYTPYEKVETIKDKLSKDEAEKKAVHSMKTKTAEKWMADSKEFGYIIKDGVAIPTYRVIVKTDDQGNEWETYVHAGDGTVLKKKDLLQHATGSGKVFLPNPVESQGAAAGLNDNRDKDSTALNHQLKAVTILGLDGSGYLRGTYANINSKAKTYSATNTFNFTRSSDSFEDVMAYYHIDTEQRYIQSLGFTNINNRSIKANVNTYTQDNSFYSPSTKELTFGSGGVDDAEDAGVIIHEYGHSIQDNQVPGFGNSAEGGAMGEGFGDFLGATYEDATSSASFGKACVAEWDATSYSSSNPPCLRRLDENKVYPKDWSGEVHADGEIWSQGLYEMAQAFGRDVATKIILQSHWSLTPNATFHDGAKAIKQADMALYGGAHASQIDAIWKARGISTN